MGRADFAHPAEPIGQRWDDLSFRGDVGNNIALAVGPSMWFRLMPLVDPGKRWAPYELKEQAIANQTLNLAPFLDHPLFWLRAEDGVALCSLNQPADLETASIAFAFQTGEVWSIDTWLLASDTVRLFVGEIEGLFTSRLEAYARFLAGLGLAPPYCWIGGLAEVKGRRLQIPPPPGHMQIRLGPECLSETISEQGIYDGKQTPTRTLYSFFKAIFDACGVPRPDYLAC
jgi:hypothetical protein